MSRPLRVGDPVDVRADLLEAELQHRELVVEREGVDDLAAPPRREHLQRAPAGHGRREAAAAVDGLRDGDVGAGGYDVHLRAREVLLASYDGAILRFDDVGRHVAVSYTHLTLPTKA